MPVKVIGRGFKGQYINTTSNGVNNWKELSPFFLGPVDLYGGYKSQNVENAWQYSKVYSSMVDKNNDPIPFYFSWARSGWGSYRACRYPMRKGAVPMYSYWDGEKLDYIEARKQIYIPLYAKAVIESDAYKELKERYDRGEQINLWDYDSYDNEALGMSYDDVINSTDKKMGHSFVIAMLLDGKIVVENNKVIIK